MMPFIFPSRLSRLTVLMLALATAQPLPANVFGDGDPLNGPEDDRRALERNSDSSGLNPGWPMSAGTLVCDGRIRGSAILVEPPAPRAETGGVFIATAAHVLYDLEAGSVWQACSFHFMGLGAVAGYHTLLDMQWVRSGRFDPAAERHTPAFGEHDWAFAWLPELWPYAGEGRLPPARLPLMAAADLGAHDAEGLRFELVAWNGLAGRMSISGPCRVVASGPADLGGGEWAGQLLDDCDSGSGASGGGLLAVVGERRYLIGVRSGSHWDPGHYPEGPPPGAQWSAAHNTNFARAMDDRLARALAALAADVARHTGAATLP